MSDSAPAASATDGSTKYFVKLPDRVNAAGDPIPGETDKIYSDQLPRVENGHLIFMQKGKQSGYAPGSWLSYKALI